MGYNAGVVFVLLPFCFYKQVITSTSIERVILVLIFRKKKVAISEFLDDEVLTEKTVFGVSYSFYLLIRK